MLGIVGLSLLVLSGWAGQISLGQMAFAGIGAWVAAVLQWPLPVTIFIAGCAGSAAALVVGLPALRLRGQQLAIVTISMSLAVYVLLLGPRYLGTRLPAQIDRPVMLGISFEDPRSFYYLTLLVLGAAVVVTMGLRRSNIGRILIASRDNERAAQSTGVDLTLTRLTAFAISGFMAACAGGLMAYNVRSVDLSAFDPDQSVRVFLYSTIGGLNTVAGPLIGAAYRSLVDGLSQTEFASLVQILTSPGLGTVLVLLLIPGGLSAVLLQLRDAWLRRVADRHRIVVPSLLGDRDRSGELIPIAPKVRAGGGGVVLPRRFRPLGQWHADRKQVPRRVG
jgi:branched-chain amino acid transport system permease protein